MTVVRILLADDHAIVRTGIRKTIEEIEALVVVDEVGNGPQVFQVLAREPIDCLLIDVSMPDFDPITEIRKIRGLYPGLKILVVSAYDDDVYVQGLLGAGVNGYHLKDQPLNDLKLAVQRVLAGERWISSPLIGKLLEQPGVGSRSPIITNRQRHLLQLLHQGLDNKSIALETGLSVKTVENHLTRIYKILGVQSRLEAVNYMLHYPQILGRPGLEAARGEPVTGPGASKGASILVVDDNARYREQLQRMIGKLSHRATIYEAECIDEAVQIARGIDLTLALIDIVLGAEDGLTCTRRIKAIRPQTRIILISAYPDREFHRQGLECGAIAFLDKKDLDLSTLRQVINDVIG